MKYISMLLGMLLYMTFGMSGAAENAADSYLYRDYCPDTQVVSYENQSASFVGAAVLGGWFNYVRTDANGSWKAKSFFADKWGFAQCNCTSYVASQLNQLWSQAPVFKNSYYNLQDSTGNLLTWGDAKFWRDRAIRAGIGVTGASDNFTWDELSYNAVFPGDVAWWDKWNNTSGYYGHVGIVVDAEKIFRVRG